ncbi:hypothetical protein [uncultured Sutterella sp.]|uniref:hypothetical protein n=1 Tax=uncultured Sutterella sp. TaxID=286133 RepID=UPI00260C1475|nr:hypothetical protein [uncultured Sutterella sp.]
MKKAPKMRETHLGLVRNFNLLIFRNSSWCEDLRFFYLTTASTEKPQHRIGAEALGVVLGTVGEVEKLAFRIYGSPLKIKKEKVSFSRCDCVSFESNKQIIINEP